MRRREVLGAGIGPHAGVAADGQGARRDDDPRLQEARHHHPVRRTERFDRHGDRAMHAARRGVFHSVPDLIASLQEYLDSHNDAPRPYVWTATAESILAKVARGRIALEKVS